MTMYYATYEYKNSKQKRWKVLSNKDEVFDYFKLPAETDLSEVNDLIGDKWEVVKLTAPTRKKLEKYFDKPAKELEGKGQYLPDLVATL